MAKVRYDEYIKSIFEPIVALAKIGDIKKLKTAGLNPEIQSEQFERFDSLEVYSDEVITLRNGDFIAKLKCKDEYYIVISTEFFPSCDTDKLFDCIDNLNAQEHHIEECFFIKLCYHLQGFYKPSLENSQDRELEEKLALGHREEKESYQGHEIDELIDVYRPIKVFKLDSNSVIPELGIWYLAAKLALYCPCLRSENINSDILSTANNIIELNSANYENIYLSLTSLHWKHIYLEVYRCIEGLYYLPWMLTLRDQIGTNKNAFELAKIVQESIKWREKEKESIKNLFSLLTFDCFDTSGISGGKFIDGLTLSDKDEHKRLVAGKIYSIRNQLVHQEDYEEQEKVKITHSCWPPLTLFLYKAVEYLFSEYELHLSQ